MCYEKEHGYNTLGGFLGTAFHNMKGAFSGMYSPLTHFVPENNTHVLIAVLIVWISLESNLIEILGDHILSIFLISFSISFLTPKITSWLMDFFDFKRELCIRFGTKSRKTDPVLKQAI